MAGLAVAGAIMVAVTAPRTATRAPDDPAQRAAIFRDFAARESATRANAARSFPGDPWSADDDFHNHEQWLARDIAAGQHLPIEAVLRAIDDGLREHWAPPGSLPLIGTVPPCHPRPIY